MNDPDHDPLELQRHGHFLRSLARSLVTDPGAADDLAQEAALARLALAGRGGSLHGEDARPWYATVLRRGALKQRRSAARREHRETMWARPEPSPSAASLAARMEAAERLLGHLNSLEPELRDALAARYYDAQTFAEASKALGVPVSTLKSRVNRGLEELRARLDQEESGGREAWLGALSGFALADARASAAAAGGAGVSIGTLVAAATAVAAASAIGWAVLGGAGATKTQAESAELVVLASAEAAVASTPPELSLGQPAAETSTRVSLAASLQDVDAVPTTPSGRVWLWNEKGERSPLKAATVMWTNHLPAPDPDAAGPSIDLMRIGYGGDPEPKVAALPDTITVGRTRSKPDGFFTWIEEPKATEVHVSIAATDVHREYRWSGSQAEWDALPKPLDIVLAPHGQLGGQVVDLQGAPLPEAEISVVGAAPDGPLTAISDKDGRFELPGATRRGRPSVKLSGWILVGSAAPAKRLTGGWNDTKLVMARTGALHLELPKSAPRTAWAMTATSNHHRLGWGHLGQVENRIPFDAEGRATLTGLPTGVPLQVYCDAGRPYTHDLQGSAILEPTFQSESIPEGAAPIIIPDAGVLHLKLKQSHHARVTGQVLNASGEPLPGASVVASAEWRMDHGARRTIDQTTSDDQGRFALDVRWSGPPRPILIRGTAGHHPPPASARPDLYVARVLSPEDLAGSSAIELRLTNRAKTRGSVTLPSGSLQSTRIDLLLLTQKGANEAPIYRMVSGLHDLADDGSFELIDHPAGHYRIITTHPDYEAVELDRELPGTTPISIALSQERRATIRIEAELFEVDPQLGDIPWTCFLRRDAQPHILPWIHYDFQAKDHARLAPGAYQVSLQGEAGGVRVGCPKRTVIQVRPGEQVFRLPVSPIVQGTGRLDELSKGMKPGNLRVALVPEGKSEAIHAGKTPGNQPTRWLVPDALGRFRFDCPTGPYTALLGTELQLQSGTPSARIPIRIHSDAPHIRLVD